MIWYRKRRKAILDRCEITVLYWVNNKSGREERGYTEERVAGEQSLQPPRLFHFLYIGQLALIRNMRTTFTSLLTTHYRSLHSISSRYRKKPH